MRDVWEFPRVSGDERHGHATPKPVAMMERVMRSSLRPSEIAFEPFAGSGSTIMGAEAAGRRCFAIELQPVFVDVICRRWRDASGEHARLGSPDGPTFDQVAEARAES
jgi:DNA modification methylase